MIESGINGTGLTPCPDMSNSQSSPKMDIKQLSNFCKVAELGSLTAAARTLDVTQAALSRQLAMLEGELGVDLFRRTGRGVVLTPAGNRLQEQALLILQQVARVLLTVRGAQDPRRGSVALGLPPSLARTVVVPLLESFQAHLPQVAMRTVDGLSANLLELVAAGKLDCAIVYNVAPASNVVLTPLAEESLYLVSGPIDGPPLGKSVPLADVANLPLIAAGQSNAVHETLRAALARLGKTPHVIHEIANLNAILDLVRGGHGYSVIPLSGVHSCVGDTNLRLHRIRRPALEIQLFVAQPAEAHDPLTVDEVELIRTVVIEQLRQFDREVEAAITS
jgi:LysR family nitrogen assimilation transcriptional regulator